MGLFYKDEKDYFPGIRKVGFARYREILEENWKQFFFCGFLTLIFFIPFAGGMTYAILSKSAAIALISGVVGGAIAGPGLACMYDLILRRLRDDRSDWWFCWKKAMKNNWKAAILPGIVQCVSFGMTVFSCALMYWGATAPSIGTTVILVVAALLVSMILTAWWVQVVLFEQKLILRLKNSLFFVVLHFGKNFLSSFVRILWFVIIFLLFPWSMFVLPFLGIWYTLFLGLLILYRSLNAEFKIEKQIRKAFPGTLPDTVDLDEEDDEASEEDKGETEEIQEEKE